ncbi:MAG: J domain-containing protein [Rhodospirillales bacterium]|nr:J domain-containing protein [Rhodospirillales bacterium]
MSGRKGKSRYWASQAKDGTENGCAWAGCKDMGLYRAPRSREVLTEYSWFCLDHIRQYNATWNYFSGMTNEQVEADVRRDTVWQRPTWPLGGSNYRFDSSQIRDGFGFLNGAPPGAGARRARTLEEQALLVFDLTPPINTDTVKARYKALVKRHHPDANGGDKTAEEKFKQISDAYRTIMASFDS